MPRHTSRALILMMLVWASRTVLMVDGDGGGGDAKLRVREGHPDEESWEGGIDRGSVGCEMGRINTASGKCMSEENCVLPIGKAQRENCMMHNLERHGLGRYSKSWAKATYACACCNTTLFSSEDKFNDGRPPAPKSPIQISSPSPRAVFSRSNNLDTDSPTPIFDGHSTGHGFATFTKPIATGVVGYRDHQAISSSPCPLSHSPHGLTFVFTLEKYPCPRATNRFMCAALQTMTPSKVETFMRETPVK